MYTGVGWLAETKALHRAREQIEDYFHEVTPRKHEETSGLMALLRAPLGGFVKETKRSL
jgi:hypothetical protein